MAEDKNNVVTMPVPAPTTVAASMADFDTPSAAVEYKTIDGYSPGQKLIIGSLSAGDVLLWVEEKDPKAKDEAGLHLIVKSLCSPKETGYTRYAANPDSIPENILKLRRMPHKATERIVKEILDLNGLNVKATDAAKKD